MTITTDSYEIFTGDQNGTLKEFKGSTLNCEDVVLVVWTYRISGTGRWAGRKMRENKKRPPPQGDARKLVMLWGGEEASEVGLGEAALLATQLRLGPLHRVELGAEPDCFTKAWKGELKINTNNEKTKMYVCLGGARDQNSEAFFLQQVENGATSLRRDLDTIPISSNRASFKHGPETQYYSHYKKSFSLETPLQYEEKNINDKIVKMFKVERLLDQLVPVQLKTVDRPGHHNFVQSQLRGIVLVLTETKMYLWHQGNDEEGKCWLIFNCTGGYATTFQINRYFLSINYRINNDFKLYNWFLYQVDQKHLVDVMF